jgi:hypothetical protein
LCAQNHAGRFEHIAEREEVAMEQTPGYVVGWGALALINAGIAQGKNRSGLNWFLVSLLLGPIATFLLVAFFDKLPMRKGPSDEEKIPRERKIPTEPVENDLIEKGRQRDRHKEE